MQDPFHSMWQEALATFERAERLRLRFFRPVGTRPQEPAWEPPVDIFDSGDTLSILLALPGVSPSSVAILVDGGELIVTANRRITCPRGARVAQLEIPFGRFERRIDLPTGLFQILGRDFENGCLWIELGRLD